MPPFNPISFICTVKSQILLRGIAALVHNLEMKVLCEGAETQAQTDLLREIGCDYIQGYYFGRPMSQDQYEKLTNHDEEEQHDMPQPESS